MPSLPMKTFYGIALMLAGLSVALWPITHPWGTVAGAEIGRSAQWMVAHTFHFLAAFFGLIGLLGFVDRQARVAGTLERVGFVVAFTGSVLFAGTGVFTAFLWPSLAQHAPHLTEVTGPFFQPPHPMILVTAVVYSLGHVLLGVALLRARIIAPWAGFFLIAGAVLLLIPPPPLSPMPWVMFPVSGVVFGTGLAGVGRAMLASVTAPPRATLSPAGL